MRVRMKKEDGRKIFVPIKFNAYLHRIWNRINRLLIWLVIYITAYSDFGDKRRRERTSLQKNPLAEEISSLFCAVGGYNFS